MNSIKILGVSYLVGIVTVCISPSFASDRDAFKVQIDDETTLKEARDGSNFAIGNDKSYCTYDYRTKIFTMVEGSKRMVVQLNQDSSEP
ncbi:MAG TPA: hypothetical protein V6C97_23820 [Oculatellaceae cyanobacterium]